MPPAFWRELVKRMTTLPARIHKGTPDDPQLLSPEDFEPFARGKGWPPDVIAELVKPPYSREPFIVGSGKMHERGQWVRIVGGPALDFR